MKIRAMIAGFAVLGLVSACTSGSDDVAQKQQDLQETRQEAAKDVSDAQAEAVKDVDAAKADAAENIQDAQKDLKEAKKDVAEESRDSMSGTSASAKDSGGSKVKVTPEQCAKFATTKEVRPEDKAAYEACSEMNMKSKK